MKVGYIVTPNTKGQIVIPKKVRDFLKINENVPLNLQQVDQGIYIHPISEVVTKQETETSFTDILRKTQGAWAGDNWPETERRRCSTPDSKQKGL
ncbi:MAG: hypothetical protein A2782_01225 [Candidatus Blackburnbacteria bacterium RIFCSPHIGHO2_01_FULL_43_15b]|uniref:SpoVT-AbrB domain-containing protein n=1 Tax=Candidatus Blackburnbacteria bacterium RIFCSPHIGHO2_01_FULL_43_15b TaxID=1797513 RepID=A0A1G1V205_9BACT|nr:MAG: hypothetical protein A2782_01225 [Candidatus Blackburnbacteria bacterium RIFCSPHIGHO2_01_FULL_43_15b]